MGQVYERAKKMKLPVVPGEVTDRVEEGFALLMRYDNVLEIPKTVMNECGDPSVYHFCPPLEQVRTWLGDAGLGIAEESVRQWYGRSFGQERRLAH